MSTAGGVAFIATEHFVPDDISLKTFSKDSQLQWSGISLHEFSKHMALAMLLFQRKNHLTAALFVSAYWLLDITSYAIVYTFCIKYHRCHIGWKQAIYWGLWFSKIIYHICVFQFWFAGLLCCISSFLFLVYIFMMPWSSFLPRKHFRIVREPIFKGIFSFRFR